MASDVGFRRSLERHAPWIVLGLTLLFAALTGPAMIRSPLWGDEFRTYRDGLEKPLSVVLLWHHNPDHAPLGHLMARAGAAIFGVQHAWALRLGSWICGLACVPAIFLMGRALWSPAAGLLMAMMLAVDPNLGFQMTQARMYAPLALAATVAMTLAGSLLLRPSRPWARAVGLGVALAVGIWSNAQIYAVVMAVLFVGVGVLFTRRRRLAVPLFVAVAIGCSLGAQGIWKIAHRHDAEAVTADDIQSPPANQLGTALKQLAGKKGPLIVILASTVIGLGVMAGRPSHRPVVALLSLVCVLAIVNLFVAARYRPIAHPRYLTICQPPLWLAMSVIVVGLWDAPRLRWRLGAPALATMVILSVIGCTRLLKELREDSHARPLADAARLIHDQATAANARVAAVPEVPYAMYGRYYGVDVDDALQTAFDEDLKPRVARARWSAAKLNDGALWFLCMRPSSKTRDLTSPEDPYNKMCDVAHARGLDASPLELLKQKTKWRSAVVKFDANGISIVAYDS